jgi:hypothetical protein
MYRVWIGTSEIEVLDVDFPVTAAIQNIDSIEERKATKTAVIKAPATDANRAIFDHLEDVNIEHSITGLTGRLTDGTFEMKGQVKIYDTLIKGDEVYYQFQILSGNGDWTGQITGLLSDLAITSLNHSYTKTVINASVTTPGDYFYPLVNYGKFSGGAETETLQSDGSTIIVTDGTYVNIEDRLPAVKIITILNKIFNTLKYKISSTYLNTADFAKKYLSFSRDPEIYTDEVRTDSLFQAGLNDDWSNGQLVLNNNIEATLLLFTGNTVDNGIVPFTNDTDAPNFDTGDHYHFPFVGNYEYTCETSGSYKFRTSLQVNIHSTYLDVTPEVTENIIVTVQLLKNGSVVLATDTLTCTQVISHQHTMIADSGFQYLVATDYVQVKVTVTGKITNDCGYDSTVYFDIKKSNFTYFKNDFLLRPAENYAWTYANILPDVLQIDFVKWLFHKYNLHCTTNVWERTVYIEPWDDIHTETQNVWTSKFHSDLKVLKKDIPSWLYLQSAIDGNDAMIVNTRLACKLSNGNGDSLESVNGLFADTLMGICAKIGLTSDQIPKLWNNNDLYPEAPVQSFNFLPRIWTYDGETAGNTWTFDGDAKTSYPKITPDNFSITEYTNWLYTYNNAHRLDAKFVLNDNDMSCLLNCVTGKDFRALIWLGQSRFNGTYYLNYVKYLSNGISEVELIQKRVSKTGVTVTTQTIPTDGTVSGGGSTSSGGVTTASHLITDATVITNITTDANWTSQNYTGSTAGLVEGNYYYDSTNHREYTYNGSVLYRKMVNVEL